jgi:hypothetical protein
LTFTPAAMDLGPAGIDPALREGEKLEATPGIEPGYTVLQTVA